ncbi:MAG: hypothetical protein KA715_13595 [Xanthomonadaceae bacterium]|nr:hypothetical protein [Xanthomonadaceae bacterium]
MIAVEKGSILIYRVFDIAEEVNLSVVEKILSEAISNERLKLKKGPRNALMMKNAPVILNIQEIDFNFLGQNIRSEVYAKIWDYGVLSLIFQIPIIPGTQWSKLIEYSAHLESDQTIDEIAKNKSKDLVQMLKPALQKPRTWDQFEDYIIYFLEKVQGIEQASDLLNQVDIPSLIMGENNFKPSEKSKQSILDSVYQYSADDLAVIDWNSAIVYEPSGKKEVPEVLEFALTQMMEMRYYDDLLDDRLYDLYDEIEKTRGSIFKSSFSKLAREASTRFIEFSEFIERIDNSLKVVGDFYLATIFRGASAKFRIRDWQESVTQKMDLMARVSELLSAEVHAGRSLILETIVVLLIATEILTAFWKVTT